jgi:hypothetical protein
MPFCNDACMKRMTIRGCRRKNELAMARTYSFHAFPLKLRMRERLMSPGRSLERARSKEFGKEDTVKLFVVETDSGFGKSTLKIGKLVRPGYCATHPIF